MRVLVIGGTGFLGRHLVEALLAAGHEPTLFHRGRTGAELFGALEHLLGDRDGGFALPPGRSWEAAIDTCGYVPRVVGASARALAGRVERLCFVSSASVYADFSRAGLSEEAPRCTLADPTTEVVSPETYGGLKALCEDEVRRAFPAACLIVRPGLIVGPHDDSDRFGYWVARMERGGAVLAPAPPGAACQLIDVRDLAAWIVRLLEGRVQGTLHVSGPERPLTFGALLEACRAGAGAASELVWVDGEFLVAQGVVPWSDLPLWVHVPSKRGAHALDLSKALAHGLATRPLAQTLRDVRAFLETRGPGAWKAGLTPERERALLAAWSAWCAARGSARDPRRGPDRAPRSAP